MSNFITEFRNIQAELGFTILKVCKDSEIDRTLFQKMITGKRPLKKELIEKFISKTNMTYSQKEFLLNLCEREIIGEDKYLSRNYIVNFFNQIKDFEMQRLNLNTNSHTLSNEIELPSDTQHISGSISIELFFQNWIKDTILNYNELNIFVPFECEIFFKALLLCCPTRKDLKINHLLALEQNTLIANKSTKNLEILSKILQFSFFKKSDYKTSYYYCDIESIKNAFSPYPYYVYNENNVILISQNFKEIIFINKKDVVQSYISHFKNTLQKTNPLTRNNSQTMSHVHQYIETVKSFNNIMITFESQPCFSIYLTTEIIDKYLIKEIPNRDLFLSAISDMYNTIDAPSNGIMSFFSKRGLSTFMSTGIIDYFPPNLTHPLDAEDRISFLEKIKNDILNSNNKFYIVKDEVIDFSKSSTFEIFDDKNIIFTTNTNENLSITSITELGIYDKFIDFFDSLKYSDLIYSTEETLTLIDDFIKGIRI